jgi:hypothetical protein
MTGHADWSTLDNRISRRRSIAAHWPANARMKSCQIFPQNGIIRLFSAGSIEIGHRLARKSARRLERVDFYFFLLASSSDRDTLGARRSRRLATCCVPRSDAQRNAAETDRSDPAQGRACLRNITKDSVASEISLAISLALCLSRSLPSSHSRVWSTRERRRLPGCRARSSLGIIFLPCPGSWFSKAKPALTIVNAFRRGRHVYY